MDRTNLGGMMMPQKRTIGVDLDDVIIDFNEGLCLYHNTLYGTNYTRSEIVSYDLESLWNCTLNEAIQRIFDFYHSPEHAKLLPVCGAGEALARLKKENILVVVTSRPESVRALTLEWLNGYFPQTFESLHFLGHYHGAYSRRQTKGEVCKNLGVEIFLEDALANAATVSAVGIPVLLFDTPWNQGELPDGVTRVFGWGDALKRLL